MATIPSGLQIARIEPHRRAMPITRCPICGCLIRTATAEVFDFDLRRLICNRPDCAESLIAAELNLRGVAGLAIPDSETPNH